MFQRVTKEELIAKALNQPSRLACVLPASPLSFEGKLLKIRWCVRLRLFLNDGREPER